MSRGAPAGTRVSRPARRYAKAFYDLVAKEGTVEEALGDLKAIGVAVANTHELAAFLPDYSIGRQARASVLDALFRHKTGPMTWRFLRFLESKRRMGLLRAVCDAFVEFHYRAAGIAKASLWTAFPLDADQERGLSAAIRRSVGGPVEITATVEPGLVGGFKYRIGDTIHDCSVRGALDALSERIAGCKLRWENHDD